MNLDEIAKAANYDPAKATGLVSGNILKQVLASLAEGSEPIDTPAKEAEAFADIALARREYVEKKKRRKGRK